MVTAKVTSKGQITIPKSVRDSLHLQPGTRVEVVVSDQSNAVLKPINKSVDDVFGKLHDPDQPSLSIADMDEAIAERFRGHENDRG